MIRGADTDAELDPALDAYTDQLIDQGLEDRLTQLRSLINAGDAFMVWSAANPAPTKEPTE